MWTGWNEQLNSSSVSRLLENARDDNQQETVSSIYLSSSCNQRLNYAPTVQRFRRRRQRQLRWQPYSKANLFLTSEQSASDSNTSGHRKNVYNSYRKRIHRLSRVQSNPELEFLPRKRVDSNMRHIVKSRSEEVVYVPHFPSLDDTSEQVCPVSREDSEDSVLMNGFQAMRPKPSSSAPFARTLAERLIKYANENKVLDERMVWCQNCDRIPVSPVTGLCGHTRCKLCVERCGACPCGCPAPREIFVDVLTRQLIDKMFQDSGASDEKSSEHGPNDYEVVPSTSAAASPSSFPFGSERRSLLSQKILRAPIQRSVKVKRLAVSPRAPMTPQVRFKYARALISAGQLKDAVAHLARVATTKYPVAHSARTLLIRTLNDLLQFTEDRRKLSWQLNYLVRSQATSTWLRVSDVECPLCLQPYSQPIITPCGHTFCRSCMERLMDYKKPCALCQRPLYEINLIKAKETYFVSAALEAINEKKPPQPLDKDIIYIVVCTVAFPNVPCPLFIFDPKHWFMIRRVLESGSRKFGMVACDSHGTNSAYGTLLEVRDCVLFENGSFILSTIGVSRFQVIETDVCDGCDVARIETLVDDVPSDQLTIWKIKHISWLTRLSAVYWLNSVSPALRASIEAAFGVLPDYIGNNERFWEMPDGPSWLWWLIAILPLRMEIKILILSTKCIFKRLMAVIRTLEAMKKLPQEALWSLNIIIRAVVQVAAEHENEI